MAHGFKTGGRKKGSLNKVTSAMKAAIAASGETPLEYMLRIMRDEAAESTRRDDMAKAAAPYLHPRLSSVEHTGDTEEFRKAADMTDDELAAIIGRAKLTRRIRFIEIPSSRNVEFHRGRPAPTENGNFSFKRASLKVGTKLA